MCVPVCTHGCVPRVYVDACRHVCIRLSAKSAKPTVPEVIGVTLVKAPPPELYPVPDASLLEVKAVVDALKLALLVYNANLNALPEPVDVVVPPPLPLVKL